MTTDFYNPLIELSHYGIPGMKWGKRKAKDSGKTSVSNNKIRIASKVRQPTREDAREWAKIGSSAVIGMMASKSVRESIANSRGGYDTIGKAAAATSLSYFGARSYYDFLTKIENLSK